MGTILFSGCLAAFAVSGRKQSSLGSHRWGALCYSPTGPASSVLGIGSNEKCVARLSKASTLLTRMVDKNVCYCRCDWIQPQCLVRLIFAYFQERTFTMALELNTDGPATTSTTAESVFDMLGDHTETVLGSCFGWYLAFTRIVTGVDVVVKAGASIDVLLGVKLELQAAGVVTIQAAEVVTVQTGKVTRIGGLTELNAKTNVTDTITEHSKGINTGIYNITTLNESGDFRNTNYEIEQNTGIRSDERWSISKTIFAETYNLKSEYQAQFKVGETCMVLSPTGAKINAELIELGE